MEADWDEVAVIALPPEPRGAPSPAAAVAYDISQELLWIGNHTGRITAFYGPELQRYTSFRAHGAENIPGNGVNGNGGVSGTGNSGGNNNNGVIGANIGTGAGGAGSTASTTAPAFAATATTTTAAAGNGSEAGAGASQVRQILFCDKGVLSVSARSVHLASRRGLAQWHLRHDEFQDLRCMSFTAKGMHEILVAGCQEAMFKIDVEKGTITHTLSAEDNYTMMKRSGQYICAATVSGSVHMLDPDSLKLVKSWKAHGAGINDMDAKSDFLVTCGYSPRQQHGYMLDPLANVFDLKTLMPLPPIPFQPGAAFVRMHPKMSTTSIVASLGGQLQVVDLMNPNTANLRQANLGYEVMLTHLEMAPSGESLALADSMCSIHLWGSPSKIHFTEYSNPTEFPDPIIPPPTLDWSSDAPLSSIGMPYYRETLLSAWPTHMSFDVGAPPPKIDSAIMSNLKRAEIGSFAANPRKTRRYQVENRRSDRVSDQLAAPKFLSEKARAAPVSLQDDQATHEALDALTDMVLDNVTRKEVPAMYGNVEIKYSKFGVDDFDFAYYNNTQFSGLETHIVNSYANPLLQLFKFTPWIRNLALHHTATSCLFENCLLCEMGFLIDMLEKADGLNCQATNLLKTFSSLSHAASLALLEENSPSTPLTVMIQSLNRFLLDKISSDYRQMSPQNSLLEHVLTTLAPTSIRCAQCNNETLRPDRTYVHELMYPLKSTVKNMQRAPRPTFSQILKASVERQDQTRGWCDRCKRYQQLATRKTINQVPTVMMINAAINSHEAKQLWAIPNWLPQEIGIIVEQGQFFCYEGQDLKLHQQRGVYSIIVYELIGVVADINSGENQKSHLVSMINVSPSSRDPQAENQWHLFNDFLVRAISKEEALRFDPTWKLPSILAFQVKTASHNIDDTWKDQLDPSLLYRRWSANQEKDQSKFRVLSPTTEAPRPGSPVAIDAEFVSLRQEEIEIKADGTRETIRPARYGLARVSVLRGSGADQGLPFIDDYIAVSEPVVDYLTAYSGISPGDLDRNTSPHALVSLKVAYKKLWILLNLGCVFVGHGLPKDFRTINIHVPKKQVVDTVDLFFIKERQRKLNLRFLAWYLLKEDIQTDTHDSVEDARTALKLWRKYEEFVDAGVLEPMLNDIYAKGREVGYKAPGARTVKDKKDNSGGMGMSASSIHTTPSGDGSMSRSNRHQTPEPSSTPGAAGSSNSSGRPVTPNMGSTPVKRIGFGAPRGIGFGSPSPMR